VRILAWRPLKRARVSSRTIQPVGNSPDDGNIVRAVDSPWVARLRSLHRQVRRTVANAGRIGTGTTNAKGDDVKLFDLAADDAALAVFQSFQMPLVIDSEESGCREIGSGMPRYRLILDPVDGSDNWARGLPLSALSCAVLPVDAALHPDCVEAALGRTPRTGYVPDSAQGLRRVAWKRPVGNLAGGQDYRGNDFIRA
jgi:fructose-1,6-bisphosphatase/inositol monophosphatase family enzyme